MDRIDLHTHSNFSDGSLSPQELMELAKEKNLKAIALTDHDTISGLEEAALYAEAYHIELVNGIELAASYKNIEVHILGLLIDRQSKYLNDQLEQIVADRESRNAEIIRRLNKAGIVITASDVTEMAGKHIFTRGHLGKFLVDKGYCKTMKEAFETYLSPGCETYVPRQYLTATTCLDLIKGASGIPILAHPLLYKLDRSGVEELIRRLADEGLEGLECIYSMNTAGDETDMARLAKKYHLKISGGSDFHGATKPYIDLGVGRGNLVIPYKILDELKQV